jgi:PHD/YefM family antitoxin component YafN of YafNO toxin-antitoxin module
MLLSETVSIESFSLNAKTYLNKLKKKHNPIFLTANNKNLAVIQDITEFKKNQNALNLLNLISIGEQDVKKGKHKDFDEVITVLESLL